MADGLTPSVADGHTHGRKKLELMTTDSLNAYDFIQLDEIVFSDTKATLQPPMDSENLAG